MLKQLGSVLSRPQVVTSSRSLHSSAVLSARADDKLKQKQKAPVFRAKTSDAPKIRKGGMTHLKFRDAVTALGYEKKADPLTVSDLTAEQLQSKEPAVFKYNAETEAALKALGCFKKFQHHEILSQPASLATWNTHKLNSKFISNLHLNSRYNRICLVGEKGSGKSTLITQTNALAMSKYGDDVVVLHLDTCEKIVDGSSDYIFNKSLNKYQQPMLTKRWIQKIRSANEAALKKLPLSRDITFTSKKTEYKLKKDENSVYEFLLYNHDFGVVGPTSAFQFFIEELVHHSANVPVVFSADNINALTGHTSTRYYHSDFTPIHFQEFEIGALITDLLSGDVTFKKGGVVVAESSDNAASKTLPVGLGLEEYDPYWTPNICDAEVAQAFMKNGGVRPFALKNLSKKETKTLLQFYKDMNALPLRPYPVGPVKKTSKVSDFTIEPPAEIDEDVQFDKFLNNTFTVTSGNPRLVVQATTLSY